MVVPQLAIPLPHFLTYPRMNLHGKLSMLPRKQIQASRARVLSPIFDRCLLIIYNAQEVYLVLDQQQARPTLLPNEFFMQIMQIPRGKAGLDMKEEANHVTEENGDERRDKRCKTFSGIERGWFEEEKRSGFLLMRNKEAAEICQKSQRVLRKHTIFRLKTSTAPALSTIFSLCNKAVGTWEWIVLEMQQKLLPRIGLLQYAPVCKFWMCSTKG